MTDRRNRRRLQTFEELLAATRTLAQIEGWHGVTIRKIAAELGMTSAAIYRYVDSKDELVAELVRRGFSRLSDEMRVGAAAAPDPLVGAVEAYVSFARNDADLYQAMYGLAGADFAEATEEQGTRIGTIVAEALVSTGRLDAVDPVHPAILRLWATVHGLISLHDAGRLPVDPGALAREAANRLT